MTVKEKLQQYLDFKGVKGLTFEKSIGKGRGWWHKTNNPTSENLTMILGVYTDLSAEWLLRGEGEMIRKEEMQNISQKLDNALLDKLKGEILKDLNLEEIAREEIKKQLSGA